MQKFEVVLRYETTIIVEAENEDEAISEAFQELFRNDTVYDPDSWDIEVKVSDEFTAPTVVRE